jgi:superfamily I DNA/RNA helicase
MAAQVDDSVHQVDRIHEIAEAGPEETREFRIFGPPGTGKTTNLSRQIRRALERFGAESVLVTSFSRAAAAELAGRGLPISADRIGTLHSHCYHALGAPPIAEANVDEWNRENPHLAITPAKKQGRLDGEEAVEEDDQHKDGDLWLQELNRFRGMMIPAEWWPVNVRSFAARWQQYKHAHGLLDFTDLIETAWREISVAPGNPAVLFVDEAQDLNKLQLSLIRKWGEYCHYFILCGDEDQCQPPGTMVRTRTGDVPIEALEPGRHLLLAYSPHEGRIYGTKFQRFQFKRACRPYDWVMYTVRAGDKSTRCTPEHKFFVRWVRGEQLDRAHVVYLMQRGHRFRVGWCKLIRKDGVFHLGMRARNERAEAAWILKVFFDRTEASIYESYVAAKYGLPLACFEPINGASHYTAESLGRLFGMLQEDLPLRAAKCLLDHHRDPRFPIYTPKRAAAKRGGSTTFLTEAANLEAGLMAVPVVSEQNRVDWAPIHVETGQHHGLVYSLEVDKYHNYIADGIVAHNCIYGWTGASPEAMLEPDIPDDHKIILKQSYRVPRAVHTAANRLIRQVTRRQEKPYRPRPADGLSTYAAGAWRSPEYGILKAAIEHLERGQTVMFLASCSYMLRPVIQVLRKNGIPFHNPYRKANGFWNPLRIGRRGSAADRLLALLVAHPDFEEQHRPWTYGDLVLWTEWLCSKGILKRGMKDEIRRAAETKPVTIQTLDRVFEQGALEELLGCFDGDYRKLLDWWRRCLNASVAKRVEFPAEIAAARGPQGLLETPKVIVGTIHSVKGGEADVVFLFPDLSQAGDAAYQRFGPPRDAVIRTFYVGMTRARETLYIAEKASAMAASLTA